MTGEEFITLVLRKACQHEYITLTKNTRSLGYPIEMCFKSLGYKDKYCFEWRRN